MDIEDDVDDDNDITWWSWSRADDEMVQYWKNCFVDTYTNKLYLSLFESRWTHIHCLVFRSKTNNFQLIKPLPEGGGVQAAKRFFRPQFGLKIRGGVSPTPFPWFRHCKLTKSARYSLHSDKEAKMTHWTRYCATASFVYHSGNPILTLNLSPSRQPELLVGSTVKSLHKHTCKTDSSLNEHLTSVPNIF